MRLFYKSTYYDVIIALSRYSISNFDECQKIELYALTFLHKKCHHTIYIGGKIISLFSWICLQPRNLNNIKNT